MSIAAVNDINDIERRALDSTNIGPWEYAKELLANRVYLCFQATKLTLEFVGKGVGLANVVLSPIYTGFGKLTDTEALVFFCNDLLAFPEHFQKLSTKITGWKRGDLNAGAVNNQARKMFAHIACTVGDYVDSCSTLKKLNVNVEPLVFFATKETVEKVAGVAGVIGSTSGIYDYFTDKEQSSVAMLDPGLDRIKQSFVESKKVWNLAKNVSILALSSAALLCWTLPVTLSIGLSSSILGSRMMSYYRDIQLGAIDKSHIQMQAAKKIFKS
ncbi:MAG: hypothetical protein WCG10_05485 [Chlamydiota bacterium]